MYIQKNKRAIYILVAVFLNFCIMFNSQATLYTFQKRATLSGYVDFGNVTHLIEEKSRDNGFVLIFFGDTASRKSTTAKAVAEHWGVPHLSCTLTACLIGF